MDLTCCRASSPGNAILPIGGIRVAMQEIGVPRLTINDVKTLLLEFSRI